MTSSLVGMVTPIHYSYQVACGQLWLLYGVALWATGESRPGYEPTMGGDSCVQSVHRLCDRLCSHAMMPCCRRAAVCPALVRSDLTGLVRPTPPGPRAHCTHSPCTSARHRTAHSRPQLELQLTKLEAGRKSRSTVRCTAPRVCKSPPNIVNTKRCFVLRGDYSMMCVERALLSFASYGTLTVLAARPRHAAGSRGRGRASLRARAARRSAFRCVTARGSAFCCVTHLSREQDDLQ